MTDALQAWQADGTHAQAVLQTSLKPPCLEKSLGAALSMGTWGRVTEQTSAGTRVGACPVPAVLPLSTPGWQRKEAGCF